MISKQVVATLTLSLALAAASFPKAASGQLPSSAAGDDGGLHLLAAALAESDKEPASTGPADAAALDFGPSEQPSASPTHLREIREGWYV